MIDNSKQIGSTLVTHIGFMYITLYESRDSLGKAYHSLHFMKGRETIFTVEC